MEIKRVTSAPHWKEKIHWNILYVWLINIMYWSNYELWRRWTVCTLCTKNTKDLTFNKPHDVKKYCFYDFTSCVLIGCLLKNCSDYKQHRIRIQIITSLLSLGLHLLFEIKNLNLRSRFPPHRNFETLGVIFQPTPSMWSIFLNLLPVLR